MSQSVNSKEYRVFAHETGHIFGAPDEYKSSNCSCGALKGKFFLEPNNNCAMCTPDAGAACLMRSNSASMCANTPWHFGWGAFMTGIDAALWRKDNDKIYFFKGNQYLRISDVSVGMDAGYPKAISGNWSGLNSNFNAGINAALHRGDNNKIYFFKGTQYVRFTDVGAGVDTGYPAWINTNWIPFPK